MPPPKKKFGTRFGVCNRCCVPFILNEVNPIRREAEQIIVYNIYCPTCKDAWLHQETKPGPWRVFLKTGDSCLRCPACNEVVTIKAAHKRGTCPSCDARMERDGRYAVRCELCGARHWSEQAKQYCETYKAWYKGGEAHIKETAPAPEGSTNPGPWSLVDFAHIREAILRRDNKTCQDCGYDQTKQRRIKRERWTKAEAEGGGDYGKAIIIMGDLETELGAIPEFEVHHIIPQEAGGSNDPQNLITLCAGGKDGGCHLKRHNLIGDGYKTYVEVVLAITRGEVVGDERAALLRGDHPILIQVAEVKAIRALSPKNRDRAEALRSGLQRTLY